MITLQLQHGTEMLIMNHRTVATKLSLHDFEYSMMIQVFGQSRNGGQGLF